MKTLPRWFWLSLVHPVCSLSAFAAGWVALLLDLSDPIWTRTAYMILHYTFAANMPGRFLLHRAYESPANSAWMIGALCVAMVALTWLTMALPLCWCAGNCCRWLRR